MAARAPDTLAPRPAMMIGLSDSAIMSTSLSTTAGSGRGRCGVGSTSAEGL
jgi:hypothetical protein